MKSSNSIEHNVLFIGLFVTCLMLIACAPQPDPSPTADATAIVIQPTILINRPPTATAIVIGEQPKPLPTPTATPTPRKPVVIPVSSKPESLHPFYATSPAAQIVLGALFVGCVGQDETGAPIALGCEQVPTLENGGAAFVGDHLDRHLEVTFTIRSGWRWTDGRPVTAQDAIYAWQFVMSPESSLRDRLTQKVFSMRAADDRTVVVSFMSAAQAQAAANGVLRGDVPFEYFSPLGDYAAYIEQQTPLADANYWAVLRWLPAHLLRDVPARDQATAVYASRPIGDGAYEIASIDEKQLTLRPAAPAFPLGEPEVGIQFTFDGGGADPDASVVLANASVADVGAFNATRYPSGIEQLVLNVNRFPFDDAKVRQAVAHAIDRDALLREAGSSVIEAPFAAGRFDPAKAKSLLTEAGWQCELKPCVKAVTSDDGETITRTLEFTLVSTEREPRNLIAQAIQKQLAEAGFGVNIALVFGLGKQSRLFAPYEAGGILLNRNFDAALYQTDAPLALRGQFDCASIPTEEAHDPSRGNASGFCDEAVDALIVETEAGESVISPKGREKAVADARNAIVDAAPVIWLYAPQRAVYSRGVEGLKPSAGAPITWNAWEWKER
jgi:ABC-type transport system substrate-binding protein